MTQLKKNSGVLLITCPDRRGLVARVSRFLFDQGANITHSDQHTDMESNTFLLRVEWDLNGFNLDKKNFNLAFTPLAEEFRMNWRLSFSDEKMRVAVFVSHFDHCLADLLYKNKTGEIDCYIPLVISNHEEAKEITRFYGINFEFLSMDSKNKREVEEIQLKILKKHSVDLIILARYMQILSPEFVEEYPFRIINIHHSFLPAFLGAKPYHRAFARGVKLIGATSHYVTPQLDEGPIIHQDVIRISHKDQVPDLIKKGRDLERNVLSQAVEWHLQNRIIVYNNKTVVFS